MNPASSTSIGRVVPHRRFRKVRRRSGKVVLNAVAIVVTVVTLLPILFMLSTSFKPASEIFSLTPQLLPLHPTWANYASVISGSAAGMPYWTFLRNSLIVTVSSVIVSSLLSMLAAIGVARFRFRFRTTYLLMLLIVQMLPQQALVIALYLDFRSVNLLDSLLGLTILYTAFALPVTIFMLRNFVAAVPRQLEEAAAIDGAGPLRVFWNVLLPLVAPGMVTTSVFAFISAWNEFIFALTFMGTDESHYTLPLFVSYFQGQHSTDWGPVMAASALFTIPVMIFFLIVQRRLRDGMVAGAVKG